MPAFSYSCIDDTGKHSRGSMEAADKRDLQQRLRADGLYLLDCEEVAAAAGRQLKPAVLADFFRQIGMLTQSGIPLVRALGIVSEEEELKPKLKKLYGRLNKTVRRGIPLSQAMQEQGNAFPPLSVYMFQAAEASGGLSETALQMANHYEKGGKLTGKVKNAMMYPKILAVLIVGVVIIIMTYVMPRFEELFSQMETMPVATRILFGISGLVQNYWWLILPIIAVLFVVSKTLGRTQAVREVKDKIKVKLPVVGKLMQVIYTARFSRALSSLHACGISVVTALPIIRGVIGNAYIESQFDGLTAAVRTGKPLSEGIKQIDGFSKKLSSTIKVGEESGRLEQLLEKMADTFDYDSEVSLERLVAMVEPLMMIIMALIVVFVMAAVLLPIYNSYSAIG